jgi:hypothetical protein
MSNRLVALSAAAMIAAGSDVQAVQWIGPWSWGWGAGGYYYTPAPIYTVPVPGYAVPAPVDADAIAYCARRYRTYDPDTGTYVGRHGVVRSCP